tara:strand:+ start:617 stop:901 length:285 start_codon:yes stop_codon:yes gene_type:complete
MLKVSWNPLSSSFAALANFFGLMSLEVSPLRSRKLLAARISAFATFLIEVFDIAITYHKLTTPCTTNIVPLSLAQGIRNYVERENFSGWRAETF